MICIKTRQLSVCNDFNVENRYKEISKKKQSKESEKHIVEIYTNRIVKATLIFLKHYTITYKDIFF